MTTTIVYLLRHAQSLPDPDIVESDWPLSKKGAEQATRLINSLANLQIDRLFSSPFRRAIATVKPYSQRSNLPIEIEENLRERKLKEQTMVDDWEVLITRAWKDFDYALPNCESGRACQRRVAICLSGLVNKHRGETLLVSSHGNAIGLYLNKLDSTFGFSHWQAMRNPDLFRIVFTGESPNWDKSLVFPVPGQS